MKPGRDTITDALPDEYKNKLRQELGRRGRQKQLEQSGGAMTITETDVLPDSNRAKDSSDSSTGRDSSTSISTSLKPVITPEDGARVNEIAYLKKQLDEANQQLLEKDKEIKELQFELEKALEWIEQIDPPLKLVL